MTWFPCFNQQVCSGTAKSTDDGEISATDDGDGWGLFWHLLGSSWNGHVFQTEILGPVAGVNLYHHVPTIYGLYRSHGRRFRKQTASYSSKGTHMFFLNADFIKVIGCLVSPQYLGTYLKNYMVYFLSGSSSPWNHNLWNVFFTLFIYTFFQTAFLSTSKKMVFLKTEFYVHPSNK